eukprot:GHVU01089012.1.p1 GENE.GHVU01089012.1~~GHVU01089012.1.p1  ORF type:complete len:1028 (-),score=127.31 GHVU01089012.1:1524-4607(-)
MARVPTTRSNQSISQVASQPGKTGMGFAGLAQLAQMGADFVRPVAIEQAQEEGAKSVYRDENGQLQVDAKSTSGGELSDAHNAVAFASYLSQRQIDMRQNFTELAVKYEFDPQGFRDASEAYVALVGEEEGVPPLLKQDLVATAQREASQRFQGLYVNQNSRTQRDADRNTSARRDMLSDDYINLVMQGDVEGAASVYEEMENITGFRTNSQFISDTEQEGVAYLEGARGAARAAELTRRLDTLSDARSITDEERAEIQTLVDDPDISPRVRSQLYAATEGRLKGIDGRAAADAVAGVTVGDAVRNFGGSTSGISESYYQSATNSESGGNVDAQNPNSSAEGLHQFTAGTWSDMMRNHPDLNLTVDGRRNAAQSWRAMRRFTEVNAQALARAGFDSTNGNLYAAHFLGAGGAVSVLSGAPDQKVSSLVSEEVITANPFLRGMTVSQFQAWSNRKGGGNAQQTAPVDVNANRIALEEAGLPVNAGSEFIAGAFSIDAAAALYGAEPGELAADVLSPELIASNPVLSSMTAQEAQAWAARQGTVKASDIAARRSEIDMIEDEEVRSIALTALNEHYNQRRRAEDQNALDYQARLDAADDTLTEQEIRADHGLSDDAQSQIADELRKNRKDQMDMQETIADLTGDSYSWDAYDSADRGRVDDAYGAMVGDADPLSTEGITAAAQITMRSGIVPKPMFNALRGAVNGDDPEALASAMEFAGQMIQRQPNSINSQSGSSEVLTALDDYRFYSGLMGATAAAERMIENNLPENRARNRNLSDMAKETAKNLSSSDLVDHFSSLGVSIEMGSASQEAAILGEYDRLYRDAFVDTGDEALAKSRALGELSRVYGPNTVTGDDRLMRHPPQQYLPAVTGKPNWMQDQIVADVTEWAYAEGGVETPTLRGPSAEIDMNEAPDRADISSDRIILESDERTSQDIASGKSPTYGVMFRDDDDMLQVVPGRYEFTPPAPVDTMDRDALNQDRNRQSEQANLRGWVDYLRNDPNRTMSLGEINADVQKNASQYRASPPPTR